MRAASSFCLESSIVDECGESAMSPQRGQTTTNRRRTPLFRSTSLRSALKHVGHRRRHIKFLIAHTSTKRYPSRGSTVTAASASSLATSSGFVSVSSAIFRSIAVSSFASSRSSSFEAKGLGSVSEDDRSESDEPSDGGGDPLCTEEASDDGAAWVASRERRPPDLPRGFAERERAPNASVDFRFVVGMLTSVAKQARNMAHFRYWSKHRAVASAAINKANEPT